MRAELQPVCLGVSVMLNRNARLSVSRRSARGFSLIELMVSITIGMIVAAGAVYLIVAIDQSNSETIQTTRVHQELVTLSSVMADDIRRARRLHDPVTYVGQSATSNAAFDFIDTSTANCIVYGYQDTPLSDAVADEDYKNYYQAIYLTTTNGVGAVHFAQLEVDPAAMATYLSASPTNKATDLALGCTDSANTGKGATVVTLSSSQLNISSNGLTFSCLTTTSTSVTASSTNSASCDEIDMSITAKLQSSDFYTTTSRPAYTYVQQIYIRSGAVKTT